MTHSTCRLRWLSWALAALPPAFLLAALIAWHVTVPYLDQWELVPLLEKMEQGTLTFADLWAPHNEHRIFFPKILMLTLASWTHWDIRFEIALSYLLALLLFGLLARALRMTAPDSQSWCRCWSYSLLSLAVFSMSQWENWFLGWQLQIFLAVVTVIAALQCLVSARPGADTAVAAILLALAASSSFGAGILIWPVGLIPILLLWKKHARVYAALAWAVAGTAYLIIHFVTLPPSLHESAAAGAAPLYRYPLYVATYLGAPLITWDGGRASIIGLHSMLAAAAGLTGGVAWALVSWKLRRARTRAYVFWLSLGMFAILCAIGTAIARADDPMGTEQAASSRYITLGNLFWYSLLGLGVQSWRDKPIPSRSRLAVVLLAVLLFALSSVHGTYTWTLRYPAYRSAEKSLLEQENDDTLKFLYPHPELLEHRIQYLRQHHLSIFFSSPPEPDAP